MNSQLKKTAIAAAIAPLIGAPATATADIIDINFNALMTWVDSTGNVFANVDSTFDIIGSRTPLSGSFTYDTDTGIHNVVINPFSFSGSGAMSVTSVSFLAIGDGLGGNGTLMGASMGFNWNSSGVGIPVTAIFDAAGFFNSIQGPGSSWTVGSGCTNCATSATPDTLL